MSLFQRSKELFAAFAVATIGLGAPAALANDTQSEPTAQSVAYAPQQLALLTQEEALEQSAGRVLLHVGEGYNSVALEDNIRQLENAGLTVDVAAGGPAGQITAFFFGNHFPDRSYDESNVHEMVYILIEVAKQNNLIASNEIETPERS